MKSGEVCLHSLKGERAPLPSHLEVARAKVREKRQSGVEEEPAGSAVRKVGSAALPCLALRCVALVGTREKMRQSRGGRDGGSRDSLPLIINV